MLSNRELASVILLVAFATFVLARPSARRGLPKVIRGFAHPKIFMPVLCFAGYVALIVVGARQIGLWQPVLLKDTILWFAVSGMVLLFNFADVAGHGFLARQARAALGIAVFLEFCANQSSFSLGWELVLQVSAAVLTVLSVERRHHPVSRRTTRWARALLASIGAVLFVGPYLALPDIVRTSSLQSVLRSFLLPLWLGATSILFVYVFAIYACHKVAFVRVDHAASGKAARRRARLALLVGLRLHVADVKAFGGAWLAEVATAATWRDALRSVHEYRARRREDAEETRRRAASLVRHSGVAGTDGEGRQLDRREVDETTDALRWLSTCHMGWFRRAAPPRYDDDLLRIFQPGLTRGLPEQHGITMQVSPSGQSWFAWRRTVTGWVYAIGANGPPPSQWFFDGPEPPTGYPGEDASWGDTPFDPSLNWNPPD